MARPIKSSMPYFSHDTDSRNDRSIKLFLATTGLAGFGFYWAILEDIYNHGYYLPWSDEDQQLFVAEFHCSASPISYNDISYMISQALKWDLFNEKLFETQQVLSSASIQRRYLKQSSRRLLAELIEPYLLINVEQFYKQELSTAPLSVKITDPDGQTLHVYGDYKESSARQAPKPDPDPEAKPDPDPKPNYDSKYDFDSAELWDGDQPIDYKGCLDVWNRITGGRLRMTPSKKQDLRRAFRIYSGAECMNAMLVRAKDENIDGSKYLTQWSTFFGAKKLENLDKWVDRGREWLQTQQSLETPEDHYDQGWMNQARYEDVCKEAGIEFEDPTFCDVKTVNGQMIYYPKFDF